jgi:hypothetical protein
MIGLANNNTIIQTLYLPDTFQQPTAHSLGFLSPEFNWFSWALSCLQLKRYYNHVELYTNDLGNEILINRLKLPYDKVNIVLSNLEFPSKLWAYPKLYVYSLQKKPFLHIDGDVYLWEKLAPEIHHRPLIAQNIEVDKSYYRNLIHVLLKEDLVLPDVIANALDSENGLAAYNAGIIGGTDVDFFKDYTTEAFNFFKINSGKLERINLSPFNTIFEQVLFYCLASHKGIPIACYIKDEIRDMTYPGFADFLEVPYKTKFIHLMGAFKQNKDCCFMLARHLRESYPAFYYRIIDECLKSSVDLFLNCYNEAPGRKLPIAKSHPSSLNRTPLIKEQTNWDKIYRKQKSQFKKVQLAFSDNQLLLLAKFRTNPSIIEANTSTNQLETQLSWLVPLSYKRAFHKIDFDDLDRLLIKLLRSAKPFNTIIDKIQKYFDPDETKKEKNSLQRLINLRLKRGCDNNLFDIIMPKHIHRS